MATRPEIILFSCPPREKTIARKDAEVVKILVHTVTTLLPPRRSENGKSAGSSYIYIETVHCPNPENYTYQILGERIEVSDKVNPIRLYRTMLLVDLAEKELFDTSKASTLSIHHTFKGALKYPPYPPGVISEGVDFLLPEESGLKHTIKQLLKEKLLGTSMSDKEHPLIEKLLGTNKYTLVDIRRLVIQNPSENDLMKAESGMILHGIHPVKKNYKGK